MSANPVDFPTPQSSFLIPSRWFNPLTASRTPLPAPKRPLTYIRFPLAAFLLWCEPGHSVSTPSITGRRRSL